VITKKTESFFRWRTFRAWFPVILFVAYWLNSYLNYHFGFLVSEPLQVKTHIYLWSSMLLFGFGYTLGLGKPKRVLVRDCPQVWAMNKELLVILKLLLVIVFIGTSGMIADRILSGAGSIQQTLEETEFVRAEFMSGTTLMTTLSMALFMFEFIALALYFLAVATEYKIPKHCHILVYGTFALLCFNSFLSTNRGNFFAVVTYVLFMLFYVQGARIREIMLARRYFVLRIGGMAFVVLALFYFFWISRHRSSSDWLESMETYNFSDRDRYGLYQMEFAANDVSSFLLTYSYACEGYQYIDLFVTKADPFYFSPLLLIGNRTIRQITRFMPKGIRDRKFSAVERGNSWRESAGLSSYGWPTVWGWNLAAFGYVGAVIFMFLYGWWLGYCSGQFLRFANAGALMICFANYSILMNSYNSLGGDIPHQLAIFTGTYILITSQRKQSRLAKCGLR
jgi:hypothetical protein